MHNNLQIFITTCDTSKNQVKIYKNLCTIQETNMTTSIKAKLSNKKEGQTGYNSCNKQNINSKVLTKLRNYRILFRDILTFWDLIIETLTCCPRNYCSKIQMNKIMIRYKEFLSKKGKKIIML